MAEDKPKWYELPHKRWVEKDSKGWQVWTDSQRQKLYDAENRLRNRIKKTGLYVEFGSLAEAQEYADKFLSSAWVVQRFGKQEPITVFWRGGHTCTANKALNRIKLTKGGMNEVVLLHELCHITHPYGTGVAHGRYFARSFLEAIDHKLGKEAKRLCGSFTFKSM